MSDGCIHVGAAVSVIENMARPNASPVDKKEVACTSQLCRWNNPGQGAMDDPNQDASTIRIIKPRRGALKKRVTIALSESLSRATFDPLEEADRDTMNAYVSQNNADFVRRILQYGISGGGAKRLVTNSDAMINFGENGISPSETTSSASSLDGNTSGEDSK